MATDRISTGSASLPLPRGATTGGANANASQGEVLALRIESRSGAGVNQVFNGRSADGRLFQLSASLASGVNLEIGQTLQVLVPGGQSQFQLAMHGGASLVPVPPQPVASGGTASSLAAAALAQMADADGEASSPAPDLDQFLLQRVFQGQGGVGDVWVLAQAWRHLVLARMRQVQGPGFAPMPTSAGRPPGPAAGDAAAMGGSLALLKAMALDDEPPQDEALRSALFGGTTSQQPNPAALLPQLWMFHTYVWNNTQPLTFWVLPREEENKGGGHVGRQATRARMLRLCFQHPVHGLLWVDVRVDELHVTLDIHAQQTGAVDALLQLRPAVSAAMAQAGLRLLRFQVRAEPPPRHAHDAEQTGPAAPPGDMNALPAPLSFAESALAPELFLAAVGLMEALRRA